MKQLALIAAAGALAVTGLVATTASADPLSPWEKFCLNTSDPGEDLGNCLDGLPSGGNQQFVGPKAEAKTFNSGNTMQQIQSR